MYFQWRVESRLDKQQPVMYLDIRDDAKEAEHNQHVDQSHYLPKRHPTMRGGVPTVTYGHTQTYTHCQSYRPMMNHQMKHKHNMSSYNWSNNKTPRAKFKVSFTQSKVSLKLK